MPMQIPNDGIQGFIQSFNRFQRNFKGDPRQRIQEMLNSGEVSQQDYNAAVQKVNNLMRMLGR